MRTMRTKRKGLALLLCMAVVVAMAFAENPIVVNAANDITLTITATHCTVYYRYSYTDNNTPSQSAWTAADSAVQFDSETLTSVEIKVMPNAEYTVSKYKFDGTEADLSGGGKVGYSAFPDTSSWGSGQVLSDAIKTVGDDHTLVVTASNGGGGNPPGPGAGLSGEVTIGGKTSCIQENGTVVVPDNFDLSADGIKTYLTDSAKSINWTSDPGTLNAVNPSENSAGTGIASGTNYANVNLDYGNKYLTNVTFVKQGFKGIAIQKMMAGPVSDMLDGFRFAETDLSTTSAGAPAKIQWYYEAPSIPLFVHDTEGYDFAGSKLKSLEVIGLPAGAVTITGNSVKVNSAYYNRIPLKVTLNDNTVGYIELELVGIELRMHAPDETKDYRPIRGGSQKGAVYPSENYGKYNLVGCFYHANEGKTSDAKYQLVATLTYANGQIETKIVSAYGGNECGNYSLAKNFTADLRGADYIVWSGSSLSDAPVSASVTAVPVGSLSGASFGGCSYGAGAGVTWTK